MVETDSQMEKRSADAVDELEQPDAPQQSMNVDWADGVEQSNVMVDTQGKVTQRASADLITENGHGASADQLQQIDNDSPIYPAHPDNFKVRRSEHKEWPNHRVHFESNYDNFPSKRNAREEERKEMMNNWKTNKY